MDGVSFGIALLGLAETCIKAGDFVISKYKAYQNAETETNELILQLQGHWLKIKYQVEFIHRVQDSLEDAFLQHYSTVLHVLRIKLQTATNKLDMLIGEPARHASAMELVKKKGDVKKLKYAVRIKDSLSETMDELKKWDESFDLSWFLLLRISNPSIDRRLQEKKGKWKGEVEYLETLREIIHHESSESIDSHGRIGSVFIADSLNSTETPIQFCSALLCEDADDRRFILDSAIAQQENDAADTKRNARAIALRFQRVNPLTFGIMNCQGIIESKDEHSQKPGYQLLFAIPDQFQNPRSLRDMLISNSTMPLDERLRIARQISKSVLLLHATDFVHKNIRPDTILVLEKEGQSNLKLPFLLGFECFRTANGKTQRIGDDLWEKNIYRHPTRQGSRPEEDYSMQHDIYSLGVCLLEIGLWESYVLWSKESKAFTPRPSLSIITDCPAKEKRKDAFNIKERLVFLAQENLSYKMGTKYMNLVVLCLTCLDKNNAFGDEKEFYDDDGILVGLRYIEKIWIAIDEISL